jgi:hypothetical protein
LRGDLFVHFVVVIVLNIHRNLELTIDNSHKRAAKIVRMIALYKATMTLRFI